MALWLPNNRMIYMPPTPVAKAESTDAFVQRTDLYYHARSERLLTVGHPYFEIRKEDGTLQVPKVSSSQFRVFRITLPDPNGFAFGDKSVYDSEKERLVWGLRGMEIGRGQPLGIGVTGHPLMNRLDDVENPSKYNTSQSNDNRQNVASDTKQTQLFIVGCAPAKGECWKRARACAGAEHKDGDCPPIELESSHIQDGDMIDIGYGNIDFAELNENRSEVPLDVAHSKCKYPDYIGMSNELYGNNCFFFGRREQMYTRHYFNMAGKLGDSVPEDLMFKAQQDQSQNYVSSSAYFGTPSGSLVSSDAILFNRPYWLQRAQGLNNGILWNNELFVTVADTTRGTNFSISVANKKESEFTAADFNVYLRHVEEYGLDFIFQLCRVPLTNDNLTHLYTMDPDILDNWNLNMAPPATSLEDKYRYIQSLATKCPDDVPPPKKDKYEGESYWVVDLQERFSADLDQFPLGRKFLYQSRSPGLSRTRSRAKRSAQETETASSGKKRRR
ncbi:L1 protein [Tree shrew papillomavirus 2]|uniref:Major capsid protein L1 n=1 Tax=Tree shrew papillomavirus 2 TaxID=2562516 RepID=A0AAE6D0N3_9PAPI|nr:L1 protein [Tree shrew papillomavirus 2]